MGKKGMKRRTKGRGKGRTGASVNSLTYSGRVGFTSSSSASTTYWMTPNASYASAWLGFTPVVGGVFGPNADKLAHTFKQFRIKKLKVELPPVSQVQIVAYTQQVGYVTTTLSFPGIMEYPCAVLSAQGQTTRMFMNVPSKVLRSTTSPWFSTEDNPGTSPTDPASDPNLSSHGLLIVTDSTTAQAYILYFTIEFRNPENGAQIGPSPMMKQMMLMPDEIAFLKKMAQLHIADEGSQSNRRKSLPSNETRSLPFDDKSF